MCFPHRRKKTFLIIMHGVAIGLLLAALIHYVKKKCRAAERAVAACRCEPPGVTAEKDSDR